MKISKIFLLVIFSLSYLACTKKDGDEIPDEPYVISQSFYIYIIDSTTGKIAFLPGSKYYLKDRDTSKLIRIYDFGSPSYYKPTLDSVNNICFIQSTFHEFVTDRELAYKNIRFDFTYVIYIDHTITDTLDIKKEDDSMVMYYLNKQLIKTGSIKDFKHYLVIKK